jgi:hypothetical protein
MKAIILMISFIFILFLNIRADNNPRSNKRASLQGSRQSMSTQISVMNRYGLTHIKDSAQRELFISKGLLVPINRIENTNIDCRLRESARFARPWVARFLKKSGAVYFKQWGLYIMFNSAMRTVVEQLELQKINSNAVSPFQSPHTTGSAVDISYLDMTPEQKVWFSNYLLGLEEKGLIEVTMEYTQTVFHVMVFPNYCDDHNK